MMASVTEIYRSILSLEVSHAVEDDVIRLRAWVRSIVGDAPISKLETKLREYPDFLRQVIRLLVRFKRTIVTPSTSDSEREEEEEEEEEVSLQDSRNDILHDLNDLAPYFPKSTLDIRRTNPKWHEQLLKYPLLIDTGHIADKFPTAPKYLVDRLGQANRVRRANLAYWRSQGHNTTKDERSDERQLNASRAQPATAIASTFHDSALGPSLASDKAASIPKLLETRQSPEAEEDLSKDPGSCDASDLESTASAISYAPTVAKAVDNCFSLTVPAPPGGFYRGNEFICHLCNQKIRGISSHQLWERHVFRDLQPYVCMHEHCVCDGHTFRRRRDWEAHEITEHYSQWNCPLNTTHSPSATRTILQEHLLKAHGDTLTVSQIPLILPVCRRTCNSRLTPYICSLCSEQFKDRTALLSHVAFEQEQIALFVLPQQLNFDDDTNDSLSKDDASSISKGSSYAADLEASPSPDDHTLNLHTQCLPVTASKIIRGPTIELELCSPIKFADHLSPKIRLYYSESDLLFELYLDKSEQTYRYMQMCLEYAIRQRYWPCVAADEEGPLPCLSPGCQARFSDRRSWIEHLSWKIPRKLWKCIHCQEVYDTREGIVAHREEFHNETFANVYLFSYRIPFYGRCGWCNYQSYDWESFWCRHVYKHLTDPLSSDRCTKETWGELYPPPLPEMSTLAPPQYEFGVPYKTGMYEEAFSRRYNLGSRNNLHNEVPANISDSEAFEFFKARKDFLVTILKDNGTSANPEMFWGVSEKAVTEYSKRYHREQRGESAPPTAQRRSVSPKRIPALTNNLET